MRLPSFPALLFLSLAPLSPCGAASAAVKISTEEVLIDAPLSAEDVAAIRALPDWPLNRLTLGKDAGPAVFSSLAKLPEARRLSVAEENSTLDLARIPPMAALAEIKWWGYGRRDAPKMSLKPLAACPGLRVVDLGHHKLCDVSALAACPQLAKVNFRSSSIDSLEFLDRTPEVSYLDIGGRDHAFTSYAPIGRLKNLRELVIESNPQATDGALAALRDLGSLQIFRMSSVPAATTLSFLGACRDLRSVDVSNCRKLVSLEGLAGNNDLAVLNVAETGVVDLKPLAGLTGLEHLDIHRTKIADLSPLRGARKLNRLDAGSTLVSDLGPLANLTNLEQLGLEQTPVSDLRPLKKLTALRSLGLERTNVVDLAPVAGLPSLETLVLEKTEVRDLRPLHRVNSLRTLVVSRSVPASEIAALAKAQPLLKIKVVDN
jgi:Leucine-rich repeat (LRR) protein